MAQKSRHGGRKAKSYHRRAPKIEPYDRALIVCEGIKSEPFYFKGLRSFHRLSSTNIHITPAEGSDPMSIVQYAEIEHENYDRIYCVFDRNGHANYHDAITRIRSVNSTGRNIFAATSWPCFEFWVLLHFRYSSAAFTTSGGRSSCDNVIIELKRHIPSYSKGLKSLFDDLNDKLETAIGYAKRLSQENTETRSNNPSTNIHELVEYLLNLKKTA